MVLTVELSAAERAEMLSEIQQVVDVLRARSRVPRVTVRRSENGELHAVSLDLLAAPSTFSGRRLCARRDTSAAMNGRHTRRHDGHRPPKSAGCARETNAPTRRTSESSNH